MTRKVKTASVIVFFEGICPFRYLVKWQNVCFYVTEKNTYIYRSLQTLIFPQLQVNQCIYLKSALFKKFFFNNLKQGLWIVYLYVVCNMHFHACAVNKVPWRGICLQVKFIDCLIYHMIRTVDLPPICTPKSFYEPASSLGGSDSFWLCVEGQKGKGPGKSTVQITVSLVTLPISPRKSTHASTNGGIQLTSVSAFTGSL